MKFEEFVRMFSEFEFLNICEKYIQDIPELPVENIAFICQRRIGQGIK